MGNLTIRKHADKTGERAEDGAWPLSHVSLVGEPPETCQVPQDYALAARAEGWLTMEEDSTVYRPSAPRDQPTSQPPHVFVHCKAIVIHTPDRAIRYKVVRQPDKYAADGDERTKVTDKMYDAGETVVDKHYDLELES
jgi:hypothetical protein